MQSVCLWVHQTTHCPGRAVKHRQLKTSWTSTETSRGRALVMEPQLELLMMVQEVRKRVAKCMHIGKTCTSWVILWFCIFSQIFVLRRVCTSLQEKTLCRTFLLMTSQTQPARLLSSMTSSFPSGQTSTNLKKTTQINLQTNGHSTFSFLVSSSDAKKKLRLALCSADSVALPIMAPATTRNGLPDHMEPEGRKPYLFMLQISVFKPIVGHLIFSGTH